MAEEPDNLVLSILRDMRVDIKELRRHVASLDLRVEGLDEKFETVREGVVSAIGYAANASRAHVDLHRQIADLTKRVEKLEAAR